MFSAAIDILYSTVGSLAGNVYDDVIDKLKNGDLVEETVRQIFVRKLDDLKTKLDCISLAQLTLSRSSLQEGLDLLNLALRSNENDADEGTRDQNDKRIKSAKDSFKKSREAAMSVFFNNSLKMKYRIVACMLRVAARIFETGLKDPVAATTACKRPLIELHSLPEVRNIFSVFLNRGFKSHFKKADRLEIVMTVLSINHTLFSFASKNRENYSILLSWPEITLESNGTFNIITNEHIILEKISRSYNLVKQLNQVSPVWRIFTSQRSFVVNNRGEIILLTGDKITVIRNNQEPKEIVFPNCTESESSLYESKICSLAVDSSSNVYVVRWLKQGGENGSGRDDLVLHTFDEDYNISHNSVLDFVDAEDHNKVNIAVNENKSLIMIMNGNKVYVCDKRGNMKVTFKQDEHWLLMNISISNNSEIMTVSDNRRVVEIYSSDGNKIRTKSFAEGHKVKQVAFHPYSCKATVLVYDEERNFWSSYRYSETNNYEARVPWFGRLPWLPLKNAEEYWWKENIHPLPSTAVAVAVGQNITFI